MSEHLSADMAAEFWASQRGVSVEQVGIAPTVVGSWDLGTVRSLAGTVRAVSSPSWWWGPRFPLYNGEIGGKKVSFVNLPLGAPATVMVMEELIACGTRVFLGLGLTGSIQPEAPVGTCFIPTSCIREEGTSPHYLSSDEGIRPAQRLVRALEKARVKKGLVAYTGPLWTTDAVQGDGYHDRELSSTRHPRRGHGNLCNVRARSVSECRGLQFLGSER